MENSFAESEVANLEIERIGRVDQNSSSNLASENVKREKQIANLLLIERRETFFQAEVRIGGGFVLSPSIPLNSQCRPNPPFSFQFYQNSMPAATFSFKQNTVTDKSCQ